ncbi:class E sortase [Actinokineospora auranticolor]|uniref:LPXTG-site transpeptidase (Sortase) family protein n=1 Tax=Actinokineospora auranticolor TaxID=155976 RepID=A0A2S6GUJ5_9PSEU|nr:class E sortase [Actinokineospora auranticolor]PPK68863.1 LPXTG-site transpeptidase (sortase) family protein [Actinokineospora auranticolor]
MRDQDRPRDQDRRREQPRDRRLPPPPGTPTRLPDRAAPPRPARNPADAKTEFIRPVRRPVDGPTERIRPNRGSLHGSLNGSLNGSLDAPRPAPPRRAPEPPTEIIKPVAPPVVDPVDERDEPRDPFDDEIAESPAKPPRKKLGTGAKIVLGAGELLVSAGLVVLLFVVYEVWITDLISAGKQDDVTVALDDQWNQGDPERQQKIEFADGQGMAKLYIPALGEDYHFTVVEGTSTADLEIGPGHYKKSALPGEPGNFAVAGHRVGKGAPFNDLDLLQACDAIVVETKTGWFVYRMLPTTDEAANWANRGADPLCAGTPGSAKVEPLTGDYAAAVGRQIVTPDHSEVVAAIPGNPAARIPVDQRRKLITLTTCHPKFSNRQRMILHGVLVREQPKNAADRAAVPVELRETR